MNPEEYLIENETTAHHEEELPENKRIRDVEQSATPSAFTVNKKKKLNQTSPSNNYSLLNPQYMKKWSKEQVCSLLMDNLEGPGLSLHQILPLYHDDFNGISLVDLIFLLNEKDHDVLQVIQQFKLFFKEARGATLQSIACWMKDLYKKRLFPLWNVESLKEELAKSNEEGGADMNRKDIESLMLPLHRWYVRHKVSNDIQNKIERFIEEKYSLEVPLIPFKIQPTTNTTKEMLKAFLDEIREKQIDELIANRNIMPFIGSEQLADQMLPYINSLQIGTSVRREENEIIAFSGTPGIGKTRCALEGYSCLKARHKFIDEHPCLFYVISFNNGMSLTLDEKEGLKSELEIEQIIIERLIKIHSKYFTKIGIPTPESVRSIDDFFTQIVKTMQTPTVIYLIIDEYQQLIGIKSSNQDRNGLGVICNALGNCKSILSEKAYSMFIPILSGLDDLSLERAVKISSFPYVSLSTTKPILNYWDFVGFFDNFCKLYPEKADLLEISYNRWITNNNINNLLHFISGLPRLASQMFKRMITSNNWEEFDLIFSNNKFGLPQSWDSTITVDKQVGEMILAYALTETTVSRRSILIFMRSFIKL